MERLDQEPNQLSFLAPEDAAFMHVLRIFVAEASRIYEGRYGSRLDPDTMVTAPAVAYEYLRGEMASALQEQLRVLVLNTKHRVLAAPMIYQGTVASATVRLAEVFRPAIVLNAPAIIVAHNHPSGDPQPSPEDVHLTRQMVDAGRLLNVDVLDHLIVAESGYASLRERGLGFG